MKLFEYSRRAVALLLCLPALASAALGQHADTVASDQAQMKAKAASATSAIGGAYTTHGMELPSGTSVREYADANGIVFAVAWDGPTKPDLNQLLGQYFTEYQSGSAANKHGHNHMVARKPDLVIRSEGRMRGFHGKAYLPQSIPAGVSVEELK